MKVIPEPYGTLSGQPIWSDEEWAEIEKRFPAAWREPQETRTLNGSGRGLACRICIGRFGLMGCNVSRLPQTPEEFNNHMKEHHGG